MFTSIKIIPMHDTMKRLYSAVKTIRNVSGQAAVADLLGEFPQTLNNWESRGVSKDGMLKVQAMIGINATWITTVNGEMVVCGKNEQSIPDDEQTILKGYRLADASVRQLMLVQASAIIQSHSDTHTHTAPASKRAL